MARYRTTPRRDSSDVDGLGRPIPRERPCEEIVIPEHRRCRPLSRPASRAPRTLAPSRTAEAVAAPLVARSNGPRARTTHVEPPLRPVARREPPSTAEEAIAQAEARLAEAEARAAAAAKEVEKAEVAIERAEERATEAAREDDSFLTAPELHAPEEERERLQFFFSSSPTPKQAVSAFPVNPCTGQSFATFRTDANPVTRRSDWLMLLQRCYEGEARGGALGLGKLGRREAVRLKTKLVGRNLRRPPEIDDIDPWAFDVDPCTGVRYQDFRSGFTRSEAYWAAKRGEHGPSTKRTNASHAKLKRTVWQEKLYTCALRVWANRARVSKDPKIRALAEERLAEQAGTDFDPSLYSDEFNGLGRARRSKKTKKRKAPKRRKR